ncbi:response regulator [Desulfococcaceae bacterium HSG8]|nr:response regulator [Desulfococcaceae bacterium HSG8]
MAIDQSIIQSAEACNQQAAEYTSRFSYDEAIRAGEKGLNLLEIDLPSDSDLQEAIDLEIDRAGKNLGEREIADLISTPEMKIPEMKTAMRLLMNLTVPACFYKPKLCSWIFAKMANLSLRYGHAPESSGYAGYGWVLVCEKKDYRAGAAFGLLGTEVSEKFSEPAYLCRACFSVSAFLNHWLRHIRWGESFNNRGYQAGMESGDTRYAGYILGFNRSVNGFYQGKNLGRLLADIKDFSQLCRETESRLANDMISGCQLAVSNLGGLSAEKFSFTTGKTTERKYLSGCRSRKNFPAMANYHLLKSVVLYLYRKPADAYESILRAEKFLNVIQGTISIAEHNFYTSLILAGLHSESSEIDQKEYRKEIIANQEQMKTWSENCPENFLHKYLLVQAELNRISGKWEEAVLLYDRAIESAGENEFIQNEALANELASKFWMMRGNEEIARLYMKMAHYGYRLWGAKRKAKDLETEHPYLLADPRSQHLSESEGTAIVSRYAVSHKSVFLDMATVMKASQAISGEIVLENLLKKLMDIVMENAGAEQGFLILKSDVPVGLWDGAASMKKPGQLIAESYVSTDKYKEALFEPTPVDACRDLSSEIVRYVVKTGINIVLGDAANQGDFTRDSYVMRKKPRSVLCIPIIHPPSNPAERGVTGVLYLENSSAAGVFTPDRVEVLRLLASQAAISIDNAKLYATYRSLYENAVEGIYQSTRNGRFLSVNPSMSGILGYDSPEDLLVSVTDITKQLYVCPEDRKTFEQLLRQEGRVMGFETRVYRKDRSEIWISLSARAALDVRGNILYYEGSLLDITASKEKAEAEKAREAAEAASMAKDNFLASMSHEIRTPMNAIIGLTELVLKTDLALRQRNYLTKVRSSAHALLGLLDDILDFSKIEAGKLDIREKDFQLQTILDDLGDMFADQAAEKGIDMIIGSNRDVPSALTGDPLRLKQILINLVSNAVKFTKEGKIIVRVACVKKSQKKIVLSFSVSDTGIGIAAENIGDLFSAFTRGDANDCDGTGLGLAITKKLLDLMGGDIRVESETGRGSEFSFTLSLIRQPEEKEPAYHLVSELCGLRILIADDDEISREVLRDMVPFGLEVEMAASGKEALTKLKQDIADERPYHLILMDLKMPDGLAVSRKIRLEPRLVHIPIIMITAFGSEDDMKMGEMIGVDAFLIKPLKPSVLLDILIEIFGIQRETPGASRLPGASCRMPGAFKVLVVEDNDINREVASEMLRDVGIAVDTANNGREAVEVICGHSPESCPYSAVLMDIRMPEMDGIRATKKIRDSGFGIRELPIIAMTAYAMKGDREKCLRSGMNDYVTKPVDTDQLFAALERWTELAIEIPESESEPEAYQCSIFNNLRSPIDGIDLSDGLRRFRWNETLFIRLLKNFAVNYADITYRIREALASSDTELAHRLIHTFRGLAGNLSATELAETSEMLETTIRQLSVVSGPLPVAKANGQLTTDNGQLTTDNGQLTTDHGQLTIDDMLCRMEEELLRVLESARILGDMTETEDARHTSGDAPDLAEIAPVLIELADLISENNIEAENCMKPAREYLIRSGFREAYQQLETQMEKFDFKNAHETLMKIAEALGIRLGKAPVF